MVTHRLQLIPHTEDEDNDKAAQQEVGELMHAALPSDGDIMQFPPQPDVGTTYATSAKRTVDTIVLASWPNFG